MKDNKNDHGACVKTWYSLRDPEDRQWTDPPSPARILRPARAANYYPIPIQRQREREREDENDDRSAANWSASKSESVRPLAARSFVLQFRLFRVDVRNSNSIAPQSHNLRYSTPSLTHCCSVVRSSSSPSCVCSSPELTKMISFTFVHPNAAPPLVCPLFFLLPLDRCDKSLFLLPSSPCFHFFSWRRSFVCRRRRRMDGPSFLRD